MTDRERDLQNQVLALAATIAAQHAALACERDRFRLVKELYDEAEAAHEELMRERDELVRELKRWEDEYGLDADIQRAADTTYQAQLSLGQSAVPD